MLGKHHLGPLSLCVKSALPGVMASRGLKGAVSAQRCVQLPGKLPLGGLCLGRSGPAKPLATDKILRMPHIEEGVLYGSTSPRV